MDSKVETWLTQFNREPGGVFITRGMRISIPPGEFRIPADSNDQNEATLTLHVLLDIYPFWVEIALSHLAIAEKQHIDLLDAWRTPNDDQLRKAMESEFTTCMQCIVATAIAIDAYYAAIKTHIELPKELTDTWRNKRTARYKQIAEVIRLAFHITPEGTKKVQELLAELFRYRDLAVHPTAQLEQPIWHPDLKFSTEWRFVFFRLHNAKALTGLSLSLIDQTTSHPREKFPKLVKYCQATKSRIEPLTKEWESRYGKLYQAEDSTGNTTAEHSNKQI